MKLLADKDLLFVDECFDSAFTIERFDRKALQPKQLASADVLLARSNLHLNQELLAGSSIQVVASPTSGSDHMDLEWLSHHNIAHYHAPGCNAKSVEEYVIGCIALLRQDGYLQQQNLTAAVIGCGHVGSLVALALEIIGFTVLRVDPPRAEAEPEFLSAPLCALESVDLISLHTPLTHHGQHATYHLIEDSLLKTLQSQCIIINAARGAVVNTRALTKHPSRLIYITDVFENEPNIDVDLVKQAWLATPHIAGHALQAKWRGVQTCQQKIYEHFSLDMLSTPVPINRPNAELGDATSHWEEAVLSLYNPKHDALPTDLQAIELRECFQSTRSHYRIRHEHNFYEFRQEIRDPALKALLEMSSATRNIANRCQ